MVNLLHRILCYFLNDDYEDYRAFQKNTFVLIKNQVLKLYAHCNYNFIEHTHIKKNSGNNNSGYIRVAELLMIFKNVFL